MADRLKVFVSYRRSDSQHVAGRLGDRLSERYEVFMDIDAIPPGVDFTDYVHRAVEQCDVLLAIIGDRWIDATDEDGRRRIDDPADWVAEEIAVALRRGVRLIPVLVDSAVLPTASELPENLRPLAQRQALPLRHASFSADYSRLVAGIEHARAAPAADQPTESPPRNDDFADKWESRAPAAAPTVTVQLPGVRPRRTGLILLSVALVLVVVVGSFAVARFFRPDDNAAGSNPSRPASPTAASQVPFTPITDVKTLRAHLPSSLADTCRRL